MTITRGEAQQIYDLVVDVLDDWISGSELRNRGGAGINEATLPRIRDEVAQKLQKYFSYRKLEVKP